MRPVTVAIHQPNFAPWFGFFHKIALADVFIVLDDVQYSKRSFQNRNKVLTPHGPRWLTVPVAAHGPTRICDVRVSAGDTWVHDHLETFRMCYRRTPYFTHLMPRLEAAYGTGHDHLITLSEALIALAFAELALTVPVVHASTLPIDPAARSTERLIALCHAVGGTTYVSGQGARKYQDEAAFAEHGITLRYATPPHLTYPQAFGDDFVSHLTIFDTLFNLGGAATAARLYPSIPAAVAT